jgi:hypothetical protein
MIAKRRERLKDRERFKIIILIKMVGEVFFKSSSSSFDLATKRRTATAGAKSS